MPLRRSQPGAAVAHYWASGVVLLVAFRFCLWLGLGETVLAPGDEHEHERPEAEDDVFDGELEGGGEHVDEGDDGDPNGPVGDVDGQGSMEEGGLAELEADGGEVVAGVFPEKDQDAGGGVPEGDVEELVGEDFEGDGAEGVVGADEIGFEAVEGVDFETFEAPEDQEECEVGPGGGATEALDEEGDQAAEGGGGEDAEGEAHVVFAGFDGVEDPAGVGEEVVGEDDGEGEGLEHEAGDEIGAGGGEGLAEGGWRGVRGRRRRSWSLRGF